MTHVLIRPLTFLYLEFYSHFRPIFKISAVLQGRKEREREDLTLTIRDSPLADRRKVSTSIGAAASCGGIMNRSQRTANSSMTCAPTGSGDLRRHERTAGFLADGPIRPSVSVASRN